MHYACAHQPRAPRGNDRKWGNGERSARNIGSRVDRIKHFPRKIAAIAGTSHLLQGREQNGKEINPPANKSTKPMQEPGKVRARFSPPSSKKEKKKKQSRVNVSSPAHTNRRQRHISHVLRVPTERKTMLSCPCACCSVFKFEFEDFWRKIEKNQSQLPLHLAIKKPRTNTRPQNRYTRRKSFTESAHL